MRRINPDTLPQPVGGAYAQIVIAGDHAYIAGQLGLDKDGTLIGDDHFTQAVQAFSNLKAALAAIESRPDQIAQMTLNVAQHRPEVLEAIGRAGDQVFGADWPVTATTLIGVQVLGMPEWLIEVQATVYLGS